MNIVRVKTQKNGANKTVSPVRLFALIVSLLLAQALGFMHGIEHAPLASPHTSSLISPLVSSLVSSLISPHLALNGQQDQQAQQVQSATPHHHTGWVADLFAGHGEESTCQVFDQLSHGSALLGHVSVMAPFAQSSFFLDAYRGATPSRQRSLIQARGPPAVFTAA
ncbi:MAG: hypothetical protein Q7K57_06485 [Burkholderiaceae bacterium]|nr:hypothetical protein [Burkholderiaceae bacterium]